MMTHRITAGTPEPLGVTPVGGGINIAVFSAHADAIELCLFDATGEHELERLLLPGRTGDIHHGFVADVPVGTRYGLRVHGPYAPHEGHRFNPAKLLVDPYALQLDRPFAFDPALSGFRDGNPNSSAHRDDRDSAAHVPKAIVTDRAALATRAPRVHVPWADTIVHELHVRGFTKQHPDIPENIRGTFAALAHPAALAHLKKLDVTTVELMPAMAWIDERHLPALGLTNYWGYNPLALLAPDPRLAPGGWAEVRTATDALHAAGLEVLLDVVYNHSGESDEFGPTISFRGLDNASYYRLAPDAPQRYVNDMGTGNCLALDRAHLVRLAMDSMRAWITLGGVDGFRFDLATALGRRDNGFDTQAPLLAAIGQDPLLRTAKLIAEPWDIGPGGYQLGQFSASFGEWNDRFRDDVRRFWRGDAGLRGALATRLAGSADLFAAKRRPSRGINFITAHDGFTLADLVSHAAKHNEANGEHNRDGSDENISWNHGVEGASDDAGIVEARKRDQRNLLATLLLARGTPMLAMGAELGHQQGGNNNAYAQDNATTWIDWPRSDHELIDFTARLIALRRAHPSLRVDRFLDGAAQDASGIADVEWRSATATLQDGADWDRSDPDTLVAVFHDTATQDRCAIAIRRSAGDVDIVLPPAREGFVWQRALDTASILDAGSRGDEPAARLVIRARSVAAFVETVDARKSPRMHDNDSRALGRLATAAGIAPAWWDVGGALHAVPADTQRSLLDAMRLPAQSSAQIRESLDRLAENGERRLLPMTHCARLGEPLLLHVAVDAAQGMSAGGASIRDDDGKIVATTAGSRLACEIVRDANGRKLRTSTLMLPALPAGRYRVALNRVPDVECRLLVAPRRCHLPLLPTGQAFHPFGLTVQTYSLRRDDADGADFGVGDFGAICDFATRAARAGAAAVGLNPLHMLFPGDRERASPYHPSDRRFIDPIHLDLDALSDLPGFAEQRARWRNNAMRKSLAARSTIDYAMAWALKNEALTELFAAFQSLACQQADAPPVREFAQFIRAGGASLHRFATFQAIAEREGQSGWTQWPASLRDAHSAEVTAFATANADSVRHHAWLQWLCERQFGTTARRARDAGLALGLYRDLAVGAAPDGAEAWSNAHLLARGVSIGAPPDPLAPQGQVWNLPPPNPLAWREHAYASLHETLAANMRHAGLLRIDHALGLARLFWVPAGGTAADGAYVSYPLDDLLGVIALESERAQCAVVGEDLGTVPDGLREKFADNGMLRYQVMLLERDGLAFKPPETYAPHAVACASTHDLPPLAGWWEGTDIRERERLDLIDATECARQLVERREEKRLLIDAIARESALSRIDLDAPLDAETLAAIHAWLAPAPSTLHFVQAEDLAGETAGQNLPGTDRERPNWRRRLPLAAEALFDSERAQRVVQALRDVHQAT
jgi:glycogen debranching enzyme GlgX/4-alpha-glucanotransferase